MAKVSRTVGSTSNMFTILIQDSSSTTGAGLPGLAYNTAGLTCYFKRDVGTAAVAVSLANIPTFGTFAAGGFREVDAANMPGVYDFHAPDAALAAGAKSVAFLLKGAANMAPCPLEIDLDAQVDLTSVQGQTNLGLATAVNSNVTSIAAGAIGSAAFAAGATLPRVTLADTVTAVGDKTGYALSAAGLDVAKGWGTWSARQTVQAIAQFLFGKRSGVPAAGSGGSPAYVDNAAVSYGSVTVDTAGNITTSALTPPA